MVEVHRLIRFVTRGSKNAKEAVLPGLFRIEHGGGNVAATVLPDKSLPWRPWWWRLLNNFKGFNPLCSSRRLHPQLKKLVVVGAQFSENETNKSSQQRLVDYQVEQHMTDWLLLQEWDKSGQVNFILSYLLISRVIYYRVLSKKFLLMFSFQ